MPMTPLWSSLSCMATATRNGGSREAEIPPGGLPDTAHAADGAFSNDT
jgi:hypothetical protein